MTAELFLRLIGTAVSLLIIGMPAVLVLGDLYMNGPSHPPADE
jgi:hypothetical protein